MDLQDYDDMFGLEPEPINRISRWQHIPKDPDFEQYDFYILPWLLVLGNGASTTMKQRQAHLKLRYNNYKPNDHILKQMFDNDLMVITRYIKHAINSDYRT